MDNYHKVNLSMRLDQHGTQGKLYRPILSEIGINQEEVSARMIISGDSRSDLAADLSSVVFIHEDYGNVHDMSVHSNLIEILNQAANGHFLEGFSKLKKGNPKGLEIGGGFRGDFRLRTFVNPEQGEIMLPMITLYQD